MTQHSSKNQADKRRVFFSSCGESFQLFNITQNRTDSSIYFSAQNFGAINWLVPVKNEDGNPVIAAYKAGEKGKLSLHGSGLSHIRPHEYNGQNEFFINGNYLKSKEHGGLGVRHLVTLFPEKPSHRPSSPAMSRKSDCEMQSEKNHPYVIILWAVPSVNALTVKVSGSFQVEELEEVPPNAGWGAFGMLTHTIVWFAYRTKHMSSWPANTHACFHDGYHVPFLIGTSEREFRIEYRKPKLTLVGQQELNIEL